MVILVTDNLIYTCELVGDLCSRRAYKVVKVNVISAIGTTKITFFFAAIGEYEDLRAENKKTKDEVCSL